MGDPLVGVPTREMATSLFGQSVARSNKGGQRLLVGSPAHGYATPMSDKSSVNNGGGAVSLYEYNDSAKSWELLWFFPGQKGEALGSTFAISADGSRVALRRSRGHGIAPDSVEMYHVSKEGAARLGNPIGCVGGGTALSMAASGDRVAVSCENFQNEQGRVEVFDYDGVSWIPNGVFQGESPGDLFGWGTSFSADGKRLAISAPSYTFGDRRYGMITVFELQDDSSWVQVGGNLVGRDESVDFGMSLDLSGDGRTLVVGSPGSSSGGRARLGTVRAFFDVHGIWIQTGSDITGTHVGEGFGEAVSISNNGGRLAASSPSHGSSSGQVRLFELQSGEWVQHGDDITGIEGDERLGFGRFGVSLDGNGSRLAYGSPFCSFAGCVRVIEPTMSHSQQPITTRDEGTEVSEVGILDWDIDFVDASVRFRDFEFASIDLEYEIHARRSSITVYEPDCKNSIDESVLSIQSIDTLKSANRKSLSVELQIKPDNLSGSAIYAEPEAGSGLLTICVRVDLLNDDLVSVVFDLRRLSVLLDTSANFDILDVEIDEREEETDLKASFEYNVTACQCDESLVCIDKPVDPDGITLLCVRTELDGVRVASIEQLQFVQGSLSQTAVHNGQEDDLTVVDLVDDQAVVRTRLVSAFFEGEGSLVVHARGKCSLSLLHSGRLRTLRQDSSYRSLSLTGASFSVELRFVKVEESSSSMLVSVGVCSIFLALSVFCV